MHPLINDLYQTILYSLNVNGRVSLQNKMQAYAFMLDFQESLRDVLQHRSTALDVDNRQADLLTSLCRGKLEVSSVGHIYQPVPHLIVCGVPLRASWPVMSTLEWNVKSSIPASMTLESMDSRAKPMQFLFTEGKRYSNDHVQQVVDGRLQSLERRRDHIIADANGIQTTYSFINLFVGERTGNQYAMYFTNAKPRYK